MTPKWIQKTILKSEEGKLKLAGSILLQVYIQGLKLEALWEPLLLISLQIELSSWLILLPLAFT
jgi:hypothetical protein